MDKQQHATHIVYC